MTSTSNTLPFGAPRGAMNPDGLLDAITALYLIARQDPALYRWTITAILQTAAIVEDRLR